MIHEQHSNDFILELGTALHRYGTPAHRLEGALSAMAETLGVQIQVFSTPTSIMIGFGEPSQQRTSLLRMEPGVHNLEKLWRVDELAERLSMGQVLPDEALRELQAIEAAPNGMGDALTLLSYPVTTAAATTIFGGSWIDMAVAALSGFLIGLLALYVPRTPSGGRLFEFAAAGVAGTIAHLGSTMDIGASYEPVMLAGVIVLVPGLTLTIAMTELATRNLLSGTARLMASMMVFLQIIFGIALSQEILSRFVGVPLASGGAVTPEWVSVIALGAACISISIIFRAPSKAFPIIVVTAVAGFLSARYGSQHLEPELGACLGGFMAAAISNGYARICSRSAMVPLVPALILLVPGSLGFRSLSSLWEQDVVGGIDTAFKMVIVAISLVVGILLANAVVLPRRPL
tara:strand:+ start:1351 stop:2559 length:1209 start_codon:yes stop_codon:yes gene_type:complete